MNVHVLLAAFLGAFIGVVVVGLGVDAMAGDFDLGFAVRCVLGVVAMTAMLFVVDDA